MGYKVNECQLISVVDFWELDVSSHVFEISLCYDKKW